MRDRVEFPQAQCQAGVARRDVTPPVGIYHRMWGAARHERATGVHKPLFATALVLRSHGGNPRRVIVGLDHCLLWNEEMQALRAHVYRATGLAADELLVAFSHTHAAGLMDRSRAHLPGGELIGPHLDELAAKVSEAVGEALASLRDATITYGAGRCDLAVNRDQWDETRGQFVCGVNPAGPTDDTVLVARILAADGKPLATVVNYACHPTTLAWENTRISPDYVGAMREAVEERAGGVCLFLQGASGDLGPREGYVGDGEVADRNGRTLGYAALSAVESLPPPGVAYAYRGPVVSGATLGDWRYARLAANVDWKCDERTIEVPYREGLPTADETRRELANWTAAEQAARAAGDENAAADARAQVERMTRQLTRVGQLPSGRVFPLRLVVWQLGDGCWVFAEGEYYHLLQRALRERFPRRPIIVATVVDGWRPAYLPTRETYGRGIYQEQVAVLAPGCLEQVIEEAATRIAALSGCR